MRILRLFFLILFIASPCNATLMYVMCDGQNCDDPVLIEEPKEVEVKEVKKFLPEPMTIEYGYSKLVKQEDSEYYMTGNSEKDRKFLELVHKNRNVLKTGD